MLSAMPEADLRERRRAGYETARPDVQALVPRSARAILDLGCASGALGAALKQRQPARVVGVELDGAYAAAAAEHLDAVVNAGVEDALRDGDLGSFDCVVAADVLEHLVDPWSALRAAAALLRPGGAAVVSVPNVRSLETLLELGVRGRWPRVDEGLFDRTHLRWFALADARGLIEQAGLAVEHVEPRHFYAGWQLRVAELLGRTALAPLVTGQYILLARKPG